MRIDIQKALRFPFLIEDGNRARAAEQVIGMVELLGREHELDEEARMLDAEAVAAVADGTGYDELAAERQTVRNQQAQLLERAFRLGQSDEELRQN